MPDIGWLFTDIVVGVALDLSRCRGNRCSSRLGVVGLVKVVKIVEVVGDRRGRRDSRGSRGRIVGVVGSWCYNGHSYVKKASRTTAPHTVQG